MHRIPPLHLLWLAVALLPLAACDRGSADASKGASTDSRRPNVLWIVMDTVRADHLSVYGYDKPTTPHMQAWVKEARVFDDCISPGSTTIPSHASMFTGLLAKEHGANNANPFLAPELTTIAELLSAAGYRTYLWAANPHIGRKKQYAQGFDVVEHPWDEKSRSAALEIIRAKIPPEDRSSELAFSIRQGTDSPWHIKACGELAQKGVEDWLETGDASRPFFIFINYMEAHRPLIPPRAHRERMMSAEQVTQSYQTDFSWEAVWAYNFQRREFTAEELAILRGTYDAALAELDEIIHELLTSLRARGALDDTIVVITADHGEHLGEHHLIDHQYSLYQQLLRVPLIVHYPKRLAAGREPRPVMTFDLFPSLLEMTGVAQPAGLRTHAVSLLTPQEHRARLSEYPSAHTAALETTLKQYPDLDTTPWDRGLTSLIDGRDKMIAGTDGRHELYDLTSDPQELTNLRDSEAARATALLQRLQDYVAGLAPGGGEPAATEETDEDRRRMESLGYAGSTRNEKRHPSSRPASAPAAAPGGAP